ncbi:type II toxin-antitoxin system MqsR family toxin [Lonepinella koalarum]|uniref:type II toxin-antitoxin system MqsR family toxin n=1 Tax=Lonepinella koalarum TaxID=53417 RepID=UPI0011E3F90C|nr:type II toxin-antitoxin system MqsR family toxin [Lonepinella koalarum]TYG35112.1 type II toxin-antitoxin system MqsR family toxin [Lonepinella koalarum]
MEKRTPHCKLEKVKALIAEGKYTQTQSALIGAAQMGIDHRTMIEIVNNLTPADFYKSMTTYANHTVWQDVYRPSTEYGNVYLKLTVIDEVLIVSFKEL